jgi:hypothetical protein
MTALPTSSPLLEEERDPAGPTPRSLRRLRLPSARFYLLTLKPFRFEVIAAFAATAGVMLVAYLYLMHIGALGDVARCTRLDDLNQVAQGDACTQTIVGLMNLKLNDGRLLWQLFEALPFAVGLILGVPVVAREIELGTAPLTWSLARSRSLWLAKRWFKVLPIVIVAVLPAVIAAELAEKAQNPLVSPEASFGDWTVRGLVMLSWAVAAFAVSVAAGSLIGRTLPAVILAAAILLTARVLMTPLMVDWLRPQAVFPYAAGTQPTAEEMWDVTRSVLDMGVVAFDAHGNRLSSDGLAWVAAHQAEIDAGTIQQPKLVAVAIPGSRYLEIEATESAILIVAAVMAYAATVANVRRRRPY